MTNAKRLEGVLSPVVTPYTPDYEPDLPRLIAHCRWLLSQDCGLAVFGTNSEGNSLSVDERIELLEGLVDAGVDPKRMMPGTGCSALSDTVRLTKRATALGVAGPLVLPPFYYKGVSDEGLYRSFSEVIQRVGDAKLRMYLYHIPPVSQVPITLGLLERLLKEYPEQVAGVKDSSGDWSNTKAMLDAFPGFGVFAGSELFLLDTMRNGGAGCISATANINPAAIHRLFATWQNADADAQQAQLAELRKFVQSFPMIPALKQTVAHFNGHPGWARLRPPLVELTEAEAQGLISGLEQRGFTMPGLGKAA